ncbi:MAG: RNA polymerase sigma factor RpoD/SigA [Lachnoclostridium sp.]|nr:RNA polymerase sigma factor RpoD/SigA [Lachnoclostridium sp.]
MQSQPQTEDGGRPMLNEVFVLQKIEPYLNRKRELSEFEFTELFASGEYPLTLREQYAVINIMITHDIDYVDEKEEETEILSHSSIAQQTITQQDVTSLMNLKNEQLCIMAQKGDQIALAALLQNNQRFIYRMALKLTRQFGGISHTEEDLAQEGIMGMMEAVYKFDATKDFMFLTYAWFWVRQRIERYIVDTGFTVRLPVHLYEKIIRILRYRKEKPDATIEELSEIAATHGFEYSTQDISTFLAYGENYLNTASLNVLVGEDKDIELQDFLPNDNEESVEDTVIRERLRREIDDAISGLKPREREVIILRFGFINDKVFTLEEIGGRFGITRERVRQIESNALRKLREKAKKLRSHLER